MKLLLNQIAKTSYLRWCSPDYGYNRILNAQETAAILSTLEFKCILVLSNLSSITQMICDKRGNRFLERMYYNQPT